MICRSCLQLFSPKGAFWFKGPTNEFSPVACHHVFWEFIRDSTFVHKQWRHMRCSFFGDHYCSCLFWETTVSKIWFPSDVLTVASICPSRRNLTSYLPEIAGAVVQDFKKLISDTFATIYPSFVYVNCHLWWFALPSHRVVHKYFARLISQCRVMRLIHQKFL